MSIERTAVIDAAPEAVNKLAASNAGYKAFNPYKDLDPNLQIEMFGPAEGVGSGFRFEGKEGKGTQTVTEVTATRVTHLIDLGAIGNPVQTIEAKADGAGSHVTWSVTSDMGYNPIFRIFGLFMDRMLGKTYEIALKKSAALA